MIFCQVCVSFNDFCVTDSSAIYISVATRQIYQNVVSFLVFAQPLELG